MTSKTINSTIDFKNVAQAYAQVFEELLPESIGTDLAPLLADNIYFEDPFNQLHGKQVTLKLFEHMFVSVQQPRFEILDIAHSEHQPECAYLYWKFHFHYQQRKQQFDGMSKIRINQNGLVCSHIDYWDPAKHIYSQIPLIGWLLNKVKNKLALPQNWLKTDV